MMTNDIGVLFSILRSTYGALWTQTADDIPLWLQTLSPYGLDKAKAAVKEAMRESPRYPPTLESIEQVLRREKPRGSTYLPPPEIPHAKRAANLAMMRVMIKAGGVDKDCLKSLWRIVKERCDSIDEPSEEWVKQLERDLMKRAQEA